MSYKYKLGSTLKDVLTGFKGVVTGRADYVTGCNTYCILPKMKDGAFPKSQWVDEGRLEEVNKKIIKVAIGKKPGGGPNPPTR